MDERKILTHSFLKDNIQIAKEIYSERGFQKRIGYGKKPAIINIDLVNARTQEGHVFSCINMDNVISNVYELLEIARNKEVPILYITTQQLILLQ